MRLRWMLWPLFILVLTFGGLLAYIRFEYTLVPDIRELFASVDADDAIAVGELLYRTRGCVGCHTLKRYSEQTIGPDLTNVGVRFDRSYIRDSITDPDRVLSDNCNGATCQSGLMPDFGKILDARQVDALVAFLTDPPLR